MNDLEKVVVVTKQSFQTDLLCYAVHNKLSVDCEIEEILEELPSPSRHGTIIVLVDAEFVDVDEFLMENLMQHEGVPSPIRIAYYNLAVDAGCEERAMRRGVRGFFYSNNTLDLFLRGINAMINGEVWISRDVLVQSVLSGSRTEKKVESDKKELLTKREREVLTYLCLGRTNDDIAEALFISEHTVKTHVYNIFKKINVPNRLQAALWASKNL